MCILYLELSLEERLTLRSYSAWLIYSPWELKHTIIYIYIRVIWIYCRYSLLMVIYTYGKMHGRNNGLDQIIRKEWEIQLSPQAIKSSLFSRKKRNIFRMNVLIIKVNTCLEFHLPNWGSQRWKSLFFIRWTCIKLTVEGPN